MNTAAVSLRVHVPAMIPAETRHGSHGLQ